MARVKKAGGPWVRPSSSVEAMQLASLGRWVVRPGRGAEVVPQVRSQVRLQRLPEPNGFGFCPAGRTGLVIGYGATLAWPAGWGATVSDTT